MKKSIILLHVWMGLAMSLVAQKAYPVRTIKEIQTVSAQALAACVDTAAFAKDTVVVYGTIVMDGGIAQAASGRNVWLQSGTGPYSGIDIFTTGVTTPVPGTDVLDLVAGDSVKVTGIVDAFGRETELIPLRIDIVAAGRPVKSTLVKLEDLNDATRINKLPSGEQWEGVYAEFINVTVTSVDPFSNGTRVSFYVRDEAGNQANVSDRFLAQRLPASGGNFVPPVPGTVYDTLRGVIVHSGNGCTNETGRGYEIYPFRSEDYIVKKGASAPLVSGITRNPVVPTSTQDVTITVKIEDVDGQVTSAKLFYAVGISNNNYLELPLTGTGTTYTATIPNSAYSDGDFVKYYVCATDNDNLNACTPNVPQGPSNTPQFFTARDNGATIFDLQFTPYSNGNSGYIGQTVTVEGIVTASAEPDNLNTVFIQQEGAAQGGWRAIQVTQNTALASLKVGDKVRVKGDVAESFGFTLMNKVSEVQVIGTGTITPVVVDPSLFGAYDFEKVEAYEGMLVKLANPKSGKGIYVVQLNADENPNNPTTNFAEFRVGLDVLDPINGSRVLAGRQTNTALGSLNFSYINDVRWATNDGILKVPTCVLAYKDTMLSLTGIMYYSFNNMKLLPRNNSDIEKPGVLSCPGTPTSAVDELLAAPLTVYPNPVQDRLFVDYSFVRSVRAQANVYDMTGRRVASKVLEGTSGQIGFDMNALPAGTYLAQVIANGEIVKMEKIVLIR